MTAPTRVLLADDDATFAKVVGEWLTVVGYDVRLAEDGQQALAIAVQWRPHIVVADIRMPRMDGLHLLSALKGFDKAIEVIFLSGQATLADAVEALRQGRGFDLLQKPLVNLDRLSETIELALQKIRGEATLPEPAVSYSPPVEQALAYITQHACEAVRVQELAAAMGYSPTYLTDLVRRETGSSLQQWMIQVRLSLSERLLKETDQSVEAIAAAVGYQDGSYFARLFRQHRGVAPTAWRESARRGTESSPTPGWRASD